MWANIKRFFQGPGKYQGILSHTYVGSLYVGIVETHIIVAHVISQYHDYVGFARFFSCKIKI